MERFSALLRSRWVKRLLMGALVVLYGGWIGYQWERNMLYDFNTYYIAAYGLTHGIDVYGMVHEYETVNAPRWAALAAAADVEIYTNAYRYPPLTAQLVLPLLQFPVRMAGMIWLVITAVAFVASAWWLGRLAETPEGPGLVYLLMLGFVPPLTTLHAGQVNGLVLLALTAAMAGLARRNAFLTGASLAVAALLKLIPLALCLYLGWRKQWLAAAVAALILVGVMATAPLMMDADVLTKYARNFFAVGQPGVLFSMPPNQALSGFLARTLAPVLEPAMIYRTYVFSALALILATVGLCWPMRSLPRIWRFEVGLIICTILLIPPYNWYHMLALLLIPLVVVVEYLWRKRLWTLLALILVAYVATDFHGLFWHYLETSRWLTSLPFVFVVFLWGTLAWMIVRERKAEIAA
jgi:hypothetical protein